MRLAFVYDSVYPWETGGVQKRVWELATRLAPDHDVHWFGAWYWDGPQVIDREGVTLHGVGEPGELYVEGRRSIPEALSFAGRLVRPLLGEEFDVIDCQEFPYFPAFPTKLHSLARRSTMVFTWHEVWGDYWYEYLGRKGWFGKATERVTAMLPDRHLAVSDRTARDVHSLCGAETAVVPNGISMAEIEDAPVAERDVDVLFVGRLIPEKHPELVVETVAAMEGASGVLIGTGPMEERVRGLIDELGVGDRVELLEPREQYDEVLGAMKAAEVLVLPSRREGFGMTALESLACGTPVVTSSHPQNAAQELVDDGVTGRLCELTVDDLVAGVEDARGMDPAACVASARANEWDGIVEDLEARYREAV